MNYNRYIEDCIESVLEQEKPIDFKINHIVMDGGSTDGTIKTLEKYKKHIHYYVNNEETQTEALNHAMKIIEKKFPRTEYIGWLNADDCYRSYWAETSLTVLRREKLSVAMSCGGRGLIRDSTIPRKKVDTKQHKIIEQMNISYVQAHKMANRGNMVCQPTVLIKMSAFKTLERKYGYYFNPNDDYTQDYDLWCRFIMSGFKICRMNEVVAMVRRHPKQMTRTHRKQQGEAAFKVKQNMRVWLAKNGVVKK